MKKLVIIFVFTLCMFSVNSRIYGKENQKIQGYFDVNINGYRMYVLDDFAEGINKGQVTSLMKTFFEILRREQQWVVEPRAYVKGDVIYLNHINCER